MKKLLGCLFIFSIFLTHANAFALENSNPVLLDETTQSTPSAIQISPTVEDYTLPYPGLLPDNPLYFLKTARDQIIGALISNPQKKAEFDLLQADKRVQAGSLLVQKDKSKYVIAQTTISKGENYFEDGVLKLKEAEKIRQDTGEIKWKMARAIKKHKIIIMALERSAPRDMKAEFADLIKRTEKIDQQVTQMLGNK